jgi:hypothetical protein
MNALPGAWNGPPIIGVSPFVETFLVPWRSDYDSLLGRSRVVGLG